MIKRSSSIALALLIATTVMICTCDGAKISGGINREIRSKRNDCEKTNEQCAVLKKKSVIEPYLNCINKCVSETCFRETYGEEGLEPGEVDLHKYTFDSCVKTELAHLRRAASKAPALSKMKPVPGANDAVTTNKNNGESVGDLPSGISSNNSNNNNSNGNDDVNLLSSTHIISSSASSASVVTSS